MNSLKHMFIYREKLDQSEEFDVIGQQVIAGYCTRPRSTCQILHALEPQLVLHTS